MRTRITKSRVSPGAMKKLAVSRLAPSISGLETSVLRMLTATLLTFTVVAMQASSTDATG